MSNDISTHVMCFLKQIKSTYLNPNIINFAPFVKDCICESKSRGEFCAFCAYAETANVNLSNYKSWLDQIYQLFVDVDNICHLNRKIVIANHSSADLKLPVGISIDFKGVIAIVYFNFWTRFLFRISRYDVGQSLIRTNGDFEKIIGTYEYLESIEKENILEVDLQRVNDVVATTMSNPFAKRLAAAREEEEEEEDSSEEGMISDTDEEEMISDDNFFSDEEEVIEISDEEEVIEISSDEE